MKCIVLMHLLRLNCSLFDVRSMMTMTGKSTGTDWTHIERMDDEKRRMSAIDN
jgi:hypothetical protein